MKSPEETALREVQEECSIEGLKLGEPITLTYHTYILDGEPVLKEITWFDMATADDRHTGTPKERRYH